MDNEHFKVPITREHIQIMQGVEGGADIYGYTEAKLLRQVHAHDPELVQILPVKELERATGRKFDGRKQLPYFGAILTAKGKGFIEAFTPQDV